MFERTHILRRPCTSMKMILQLWDPGPVVVLAQLLRMEAGLVLLETLFNWRSAWKIRAQVEMLEIAKKDICVFSLVRLVPVDQL